MKSLYNENYHKSRYKYYARHTERIFFALLAYLGKPNNYLDVGCGYGNLVDVAYKNNIHAVGVDISLPDYNFIANNNCVYKVLAKKDLTKPLDLSDIEVPGYTVDKRYGIVTCLEVAEHLPEDSSTYLLDSLHKYTLKYLVFTAAIPGQGGKGHINEKPVDWWRTEFAARGFEFRTELTDKIKVVWRDVCGPCWWYPQNLSIYTLSE